MTKIDRNHCASAAEELNETNDCVVRALAVATEIPYKEMHEYLAACGRKPRDGAPPWLYHKALKDLGYKLTKLSGPEYDYRPHWVAGFWRYDRRSRSRYWVNDSYRTKRVKVAPGKDYSAATIVTLAKELTEGTYLVGTNGHVACLKNGEVHDWTKGRRHRVLDVYRVEEGENAKH